MKIAASGLGAALPAAALQLGQAPSARSRCRTAR
jgi:hypothetical protein